MSCGGAAICRCATYRRASKPSLNGMKGTTGSLLCAWSKVHN